MKEVHKISPLRITICNLLKYKGVMGYDQIKGEVKHITEDDSLIKKTLSSLDDNCFIENYTNDSGNLVYSLVEE